MTYSGTHLNRVRLNCFSAFNVVTLRKVVKQFKRTLLYSYSCGTSDALKIFVAMKYLCK